MDGQNSASLSAAPTYQQTPAGKAESLYELPFKPMLTPAVEERLERKSDGSLWYTQYYYYNQGIGNNSRLLIHVRGMPLDVYGQKLLRIKAEEDLNQKIKEALDLRMEYCETLLDILQLIPGEGQALRVIRTSLFVFGKVNDVRKFVASNDKMYFVTQKITEEIIGDLVKKGNAAVMLINPKKLGNSKSFMFDLSNYAQTKMLTAKLLPDIPDTLKSETDRRLYQIHQCRYEWDSVYRRQIDFAINFKAQTPQKQLPLLKSTYDFRPGNFTPVYTSPSKPVEKKEIPKTQSPSIKINKPFG